MITPRVARLRQREPGRPAVRLDRAGGADDRLLQDYAGSLSAPLLRARAFEHLLEHKAIWLGDGELIVGEKGPAPKATPTYPELCCHSLADLDLLNSREKIPFAVRSEARATYEREIIPFWRGRSMRDQLFAAMTDEWKAAYAAGVFTEFMEQRAPGHTVLDDKIYRRGLLDAVAGHRRATGPAPTARRVTRAKPAATSCLRCGSRRWP